MKGFTDEQTALLDQQLDPKLGNYRKADKGRDVSYLEGYQVIAQANRIFGYDAWGYSVDRLDILPMSDGKGMLYWALVTVNAEGCGMRQDVGCHAIRNTIDQDGKEKDNVNNPDQHDLARKSCVTDALKRAFRTFGDQFGNSLYDKDSDIHNAIHAAVREEQQEQRRQQSSPQRQGQRAPAQHPAPAPADPKREALIEKVMQLFSADKEAATRLEEKLGKDIASIVRTMAPSDLDKTLLRLQDRAQKAS